IGFCGYTLSDSHADIYRNDAGVFTNVATALSPLIYDSATAWGDYDNDGDLDLALAGGLGSSVTRIYRNDGVAADATPTPPTGLFVTADAQKVTLHWNASTDAQGAAGLSYN